MEQNDRTIINCRAPDCKNSVEVIEQPRHIALDRAEAIGWSINPHARGVWTYCPFHAKEYEGKTPSGRPLIGF